MLAERVKEWTREWRDEGLREGRDEGLRIGRAEGSAAVLTRLLGLRFGPLSEEHRRRIAGADEETILRWSDRVLTAPRVEDVFA